ncbi:MAG TPA: alkaline phosphatase family protein [Stellaceae bacterium]|nr:alkaline phosphatase family protein [Stellaceae bacterium]
MPALSGINHVVVLMLENRSFDSMLGTLYPKSDGFNGLSGEETNPFTDPATGGAGAAIPVWNDTGMDPATARIPDPDPGELFQADMVTQLYGLGGSPTAGPPTMSGFADNYARQAAAAGAAKPDPKAVMHYFTPAQVPVISALATAFGVCDQWHASAPCQTWPNRFFAHTATAGGWVDNEPFHFPYEMATIFERLSACKKSWKVYFHDVPQSMTLANLWFDAPFHFRMFEDEFEADCRDGNLPNYSFIEPRYFTNEPLGLIPNDQHPPHNVVYGEQLIARVYNALRAAPTWTQTLFIITYDEHGGCFDHVPPPKAVVPDAASAANTEFSFDRYGVRVPAVIISPYIAPGSVVRVVENGLPGQGPPYPFDHTSIIATLRKLFDLGDPLTARDEAAPDLIRALSLNDPTNLGPESIAATTRSPTTTEVADASAAPPNDLQHSLCHMTTTLPAKATQAEDRIDALRQGAAGPATTHATVADALSAVTDRVTAFLDTL